MNSTSLSLLQRLQQGSDQVCWNQLLGIYKPLIWGWLRRHNTPLQDAEDLTQEVLAIVVKELPKFNHNGQKGAFRAWLRTITSNRLRVYWRGNKGRSPTDWQTFADQLEDSTSELAQEWDRQHDSFLLRKLLDQMEEEFEPKTVKAFRRVARWRESGAGERGDGSRWWRCTSQSRVLRRLREVGSGSSVCGTTLRVVFARFQEDQNLTGGEPRCARTTGCNGGGCIPLPRSIPSATSFGRKGASSTAVWPHSGRVTHDCWAPTRNIRPLLRLNLTSSMPHSFSIDG